jgi:hypothetical protein
MYSQWINITERDLIQKGGTYTRVKTGLKLDKLVLNMTLPNVGNSIGQFGQKDNRNSAGKGSFGQPGQNSQKQDQETSLRESALNLSVMSLLAVVSGQRPILTKARKSIANWKIRKNQVLGFKVTLRGKVIYEFLDKTVRFQSINEQDPLSGISNGSTSLRGKVDKVFDLRPQTQVNGLYTLQSLGNINIGIKTLNFYPELEDFWLAQNLGQKGDSSGKSGSSRFLGLDLSLSFKKSNELSYLVNSILRQSGGSDKVNLAKVDLESIFKKLPADKWSRDPNVLEEKSLSKL